MLKVLKKLNEKLPGFYDTNNLMLSSTHTHSTPGGYMLHMLFDLSTWGFIQQTLNCLVKGITLVSLLSIFLTLVFDVFINTISLIKRIYVENKLIIYFKIFCILIPNKQYFSFPPSVKQDDQIKLKSATLVSSFYLRSLSNQNDINRSVHRVTLKMLRTNN